MALANFADYDQGKAKAFFYLAQVCFHKGEYNEAFEKLMHSQEFGSGKKDPQLMSEISRVRGQIFAYVGLNNAAINEFKVGLRYLKKIKDKKVRDYLTSLAYENLSIVYNRLGEHQIAKDMYLKNQELLESMEESFVFRNLINLYTSLSWYDFNNEEYDLANQRLDKAIKLLEKYNFPYSSRTYMYKGDVLEKAGDIDNAIIYYKKSLENLQITKLSSELPIVHANLARLYSKAGDTVKTKEHEFLSADYQNKISQSKVNTIEVAVESLLKYQTEYNGKSFL